VALLPFPALVVLQRLRPACGDGLCGFWDSLLVLAALLAITIVLIARSANRDETPALLRIVPLVIWILSLAPLIA
jgi:hypothetical protein